MYTPIPVFIVHRGIIHSPFTIHHSHHRVLVLRDIVRLEQYMATDEFKGKSQGHKEWAEKYRVALHNDAERLLCQRRREADGIHDVCLRIMQVLSDLAVPAFKQRNTRTNAGKLSAGLSNRFGMMHVPDLQDLIRSRRHADPAQFTTHTVLEAGTSKICLNCGARHPSLGGSRTFVCPDPTCQWVGKRDLDAVVAILRADANVRQNIVRHIEQHNESFLYQLQLQVRPCGCVTHNVRVFCHAVRGSWA